MGGGYFVRNTFNWDKTKASPFWYVIKDSFNDLADIPSKYRGRVKKAMNNFEIMIISKDEMLKSGWEVWKRSCENYKIKTPVPSMKSFENAIKSLDENAELWGCYYIASGQMAGFAINKVYDEYVDYSTMKFHPDYLAKFHSSYGLIFTMNKYYLEEKKYKYVLDGARSITNHSDIQPFLIEKFKFRKAYCELQVFYRPWIGVVVRILFPFRRWIKNKNIAAVLRQEAWARGLEK